MFWLIETEEQINYFIKYPPEEAFIEIIPYHNNIHPAINDVSLVYYRPSSDSKGYMLCLRHSETLSINKTLVDALLSKIDRVWVRDKKNALFYFPIKNMHDINILSPTYIQDLTLTHTHFLHKYPNNDSINRIIPIVKHYEYCENVYNNVKDYIPKELPPYFDFYNNKTTLAFFGVEKNGLSIDKDVFEQHFKINPLFSVRENKIYTHYNLYTTTRRPSNSFNGINFAALNKENGSRKSFIPVNDELIEFDISAYHPHLAAKLVGFEFGDQDVHQMFADIYGVSYKESKSITFKQLYGGIFKEYEHIEFFQKIKKFIQEKWEEYNRLGHIMVPGSNYIFEKNKLEDMNPQKLFNYTLQNLETTSNVGILMDIHKLLLRKNTKIILYTYDSFTFDLDRSEDLLEDINNIFKKRNLQVKVKRGSSYDFE